MTYTSNGSDTPAGRGTVQCSLTGDPRSPRGAEISPFWVQLALKRLTLPCPGERNCGRRGIQLPEPHWETRILSDPILCGDLQGAALESRPDGPGSPRSHWRFSRCRLLGRGGFRSGHRAARPADRQRQGHQRDLLGGLHHLRSRLRPRRGRAHPLHHPLPPAARRPSTSRAPRSTATPGSRSSGRSSRAHPRRPSRSTSLRTLPPSRPPTAATSSGPRRGAPVLLAVRVRERRHLDRHARLPVDEPVALEITALDVDHSWWVPELTGKKDALPGKVNELSFTPQKRGHVRRLVRRALRRAALRHAHHRRSRRAR